jgi:5,10-methenyltetrahydromethanopterin hydrogenase
VLPVGLAISYASLLTTGEHTNVTTARIEVLISDSQTKEPLFSAIDITAGEKSLDNILEPEEEIKSILRGWVNKLEQTLNQIPENAK